MTADDYAGHPSKALDVFQAVRNDAIRRTVTADDLRQRIDAALDGTTPGPDDPTALHYGDFGWYVTDCAAGETEDSEQGKRDALLFAASPSLLRECRDALAGPGRRITDPARHAVWHAGVVAQGGPTGVVDAVTLQRARGFVPPRPPDVDRLADLRARRSRRPAPGVLRRRVSA